MSAPQNYPPPSYDAAAAGAADYAKWVPANRLQRFQQLCSDHEISNLFASRLRVLERFDIVLVCDDSGSMRAPVEVPSAQQAFAPTVSRWDELKRSVSTVASIAACLDDDGIDIHFLNRASLRAVRDTGAIEAAFAPPPSGFTPIAATLQRILAQRGPNEKQLLLVVFTDGEPTDMNGQVDIAGLERLLRQRPPNVFTTLVACTSDEVTYKHIHTHTYMRGRLLWYVCGLLTVECCVVLLQQAVAYMNRWDEQIPRVDVCDDYHSEKREILRARGPNFPFSHGDYCVKLLLGAIDAQMDSLDESGVRVGQPQFGAQYAPQQQVGGAGQMRPPPSQSQSSCCTIA